MASGVPLVYSFRLNVMNANKLGANQVYTVLLYYVCVFVLCRKLHLQHGAVHVY